ncbi:MATE family efflux transporter [Xanthomonas cucurbitae]|uniref:MATE family efflux transporter n=1 Tax=Xanthomonas cucurbitae TaxID=56453 RepID=A0A2S7DWQ8_9XANT|nr:MATE family efflux transporter [Xanthomonas cucurbitae]PPU78179.1 MATE family efflux transporter [Xanthomonas cucurbitae]WDM68759.1 MATE family efflux transporter [Xanthomonas cucurbitae]WDM72631.1 MATE family efflux transporter [Xanthomonas cucurbitae]WDM78130.1 MATE family efflux transporter [Xanthomonas cucurbitae]WDM81810.1 MATE family efflux transporter [Xanthomonas cucurbitae]
MPTSAVLTEGPIGKRLLLFAMPILAGNIAQSLNGSINAIWVGRYLGEAALTAAANANSILFFLVGSVFGIGMASTILIGQAMGARDIAQARKVMGTSASFFGGLSVVIALLGWYLSPQLLAAMGTPAASQALAEDYLRVIFLAMPTLYLFAFLSAALRGTGDARTPFRFLLLSVVLDIVFNPLLLFGIGPFPALGIAGAAWATLIAQVAALAGLLVSLRRKRHILWLGRRDLHLFRIDTAILRALIVKGVPMGLQMVLISLAMIAMLTLVNGFGTDTAAAYGAALQLWTYVQMPAMALGAACSTMAAQNVGAGLWARVDATARTGIAANFLMTGLLIAPLILFDRWTLALFLPGDSPALEIARHLNHISIWSFLLFGVTFVISGVVRATGAVIPPLLILAFALWGVRIPLANLLLPELGADAVWWSFPISSACSMLLSLAYYRWGGWRRVRMLATPPAPEEVAVPAEVSTHPANLVADPAPVPPAPRQPTR